MKRSLGCLVVAALAACTAPSAWAGTVEEAGRSFADAVDVSDGNTNWTLHATGKATRKKFVVKVYAMAHYMDIAEFPTRDDAIKAALDGTHPRRIEMEFVRNVGIEKVTNAYREAFEKNTTAEEFQEIESLVDRFIGYNQKDAADGDRFVFTAFPSGRVDFEIQGEAKPPIANATFARALWTIWLGEHSVVKRKKLVQFTAKAKKRRGRGRR